MQDKSFIMTLVRCRGSASEKLTLCCLRLGGSAPAAPAVPAALPAAQHLAALPGGQGGGVAAAPPAASQEVSISAATTSPTTGAPWPTTSPTSAAAPTTAPALPSSTSTSGPRKRSLDELEDAWNSEASLKELNALSLSLSVCVCVRLSVCLSATLPNDFETDCDCCAVAAAFRTSERTCRYQMSCKGECAQRVRCYQNLGTCGRVMLHDSAPSHAASPGGDARAARGPGRDAGGQRADAALETQEGAL